MKRDYMFIVALSIVLSVAFVGLFTLAMTSCAKNTVNQTLTPRPGVVDHRTLEPGTCEVPAPETHVHGKKNKHGHE